MNRFNTLSIMRTFLICFFLVLASSVQAQKNWGIGVRLGDPSGITAKKYFGNNALEISIGRTHWFSGRGWYRNRFDKWYEDQRFDYKEYQFIGYRASAPIGLQVHYLFQKSINSIGDSKVSGLDWYLGFGGQLRFRNYDYDYRYKLHGDPNWYYERGGRVSDIDLGVDGVIGLEYTFEEVPVSVFLDVTLFMEILDDPFLFYFQGGLGARYNF